MPTALHQFIHSHVSIPEATAARIAGAFQKKTLKKGELFLKAGKVSDEYLFLESGFIRSFLFDTEGNEITLNFYSGGNVVFEVASFFQRVPSQESFQALTDCTVWALTYADLNQLFHEVPEFREMGRTLLVKGFISFKMRTLSMINQTAEQRYETLLKTQPEVFQYAPLKYIASYLGVTDSSLSRIRKELAQK